MVLGKAKIEAIIIITDRHESYIWTPQDFKDTVYEYITDKIKYGWLEIDMPLIERIMPKKFKNFEGLGIEKRYKNDNDSFVFMLTSKFKYKNNEDMYEKIRWYSQYFHYISHYFSAGDPIMKVYCESPLDLDINNKENQGVDK